MRGLSIPALKYNRYVNTVSIAHLNPFVTVYRGTACFEEHIRRLSCSRSLLIPDEIVKNKSFNVSEKEKSTTSLISNDNTEFSLSSIKYTPKSKQNGNDSNSDSVKDLYTSDIAKKFTGSTLNLNENLLKKRSKIEKTLSDFDELLLKAEESPGIYAIEVWDSFEQLILQPEIANKMTSKSAKRVIRILYYQISKLKDSQKYYAVFQGALMQYKWCSMESYSENAILCKKRNTLNFEEAKNIIEDFKNREVLDEDTFSIIIDGLWPIHDFSDIAEIWKLADANGYGMYPHVVYGVLSSLIRVKGINYAFMFMEKLMDDRNYIPTVYQFCLLMTRFFEKGDHDMTYKVYNIMLQYYVKPSPVAVNILLQSFFAQGKITEALYLFNNMESFGILRNDITYMIAIFNMSRNSMLSEARSIFDKLVDQKGQELSPKVWSTMIYSYISQGMTMHALDIIENMRKLGINDTEHSTASLIVAHARLGNVYIVKELFQNLMANCIPNVIHFNALITAYIESDELDKAVKELSKMNLLGVTPNRATFQILIHGSLSVGEFSLAMDFYKKALDIRDRPTQGTFCELITGASNLGRISTALKVYEDMRKLGIPLTRKAGHSLCRCVMYRSKDLEEVFSILKDMCGSNVVPSSNLFLKFIRMSSVSKHYGQYTFKGVDLYLKQSYVVNTNIFNALLMASLRYPTKINSIIRKYGKDIRFNHITYALMMFIHGSVERDFTKFWRLWKDYVIQANIFRARNNGQTSTVILSEVCLEPSEFSEDSSYNDRQNYNRSLGIIDSDNDEMMEALDFSKNEGNKLYEYVSMHSRCLKVALDICQSFGRVECANEIKKCIYEFNVSPINQPKTLRFVKTMGRLSSQPAIMDAEENENENSNDFLSTMQRVTDVDEIFGSVTSHNTDPVPLKPPRDFTRVF